MEGIAKKYLCQLKDRAAAAGMQLTLPEGLAAVLGKESRGRGGARHLRHLVQERVEGPLSVHLLQCVKQPSKVQGIWKEGRLEFV